ncbi:MAG: DUF4395 domain-containing protein [Ginsengibacter sp.]
MKNKNKIIKFGEDVEGYSIPVLNEREIRASAGILFLFMFISLMLILFKENFLLIKYVIVIFLSDLIIRVFVNPKFSPTLIIARLIVGRQVPEYVGAAQKKFAWKIGIVLASLMFILLVVINSYSIFTGVTCLVCLVFLFFESAFGICLGCLVYPLFYKEKAQYCAGEVCDVTKKQDIQKTSGGQILVLLGLIMCVIFLIFFFNAQFGEQPKNLWAIINSVPSK